MTTSEDCEALEALAKQLTKVGRYEDAIPSLRRAADKLRRIEEVMNGSESAESVCLTIWDILDD
jgi:hypothetical protein